MPNPEDLQRRYTFLLQHPTERMDLELKRWFDFGSNEGKAKVLRGCFALRNTNGGYLVVGVDEDTGKPEPAPWSDPHTHFRPDDIQNLLSAYASTPFPVEVHHLIHEGAPVVLIDVPGEIQTPVITKKDLPDPQGSRKPLVEAHTLYCRTLNSNRTYSSSRANHQDYAKVMDICWQNREMNIASFVKRHWLDLQTAVSALPGSRKEKLDEFMAMGLVRFKALLEELDMFSSPMPGMFTVGFCWDKDTTAPLEMRPFLRKVLANAPDMTGWPLWLDPATQSMPGPVVKDSRWEGMLAQLEDFEGARRFNSLSFFMCDPLGLFFHHRAFFEDLVFGFRPRPPGWRPGHDLTMDQVLLETTEALVGAKRITESLWEDDRDSMPALVHVHLTWSGLKGRILCREVHPFRVLWHQEFQTQTDLITRVVQLPMSAPNDVITDLVHKVTCDLFQQFGGFQVSIHEVTRILEDAWRKVR